MLQHLPHLHYSNDGRLDQKLPVLLDVLVSGFLFDLEFRLHRYIDVDTQFFTEGKNDVFRDLKKPGNKKITGHTHFLYPVNKETKEFR